MIRPSLRLLPLRRAAGAVLLAACSAATTEGAPAELTALALVPVAATLVPGGTEQFVVSGLWSDGSAAVPQVEYAATGGTIGATGLYTAGAAAGEYRVIARHVASGRADTSVVTVASAPAATIHLLERFEDDNAAARGWYDNTAFTTTAAEHIPGSTRSLAWTWAVGQQLPGFGGAARHAIPASEALYISFWVKYSTNWVGSGASFHPHEFYLLTTESGTYTGPSYTALTTYIEHNYQNGGIPRISTSDGLNIDLARRGVDLTSVTESRATAGCNGNSDGTATDCYSIGGGLYNNGKFWLPAGSAPAFLPNPGPGYKADWHHVEVVLRMNSIVNGIGQLDGIAQYWFDGALLIDRRNVLFRTGARATMRWNQVLLGPYIGPGSPVAQTTWIDDLLIADRKP